MTMTTTKRIIYTFFSQHRRLAMIVLSLDFFSNVITLFIPLIITQTYSVLFGYQSARGRLLEQSGIPWSHSFFNWLLLLTIIIIVKGISDYLKKQQRGKLIETFLYWLRDKLFRHQLRMDIKQYEERGIGRYLLRFSGDLSSVQQFLSKGILQFAADAMLVIMGIGLIFWLDSRLGILMLLTLALLGVVVWFINQQIERLEIERRDERSALLSFINVRLLNILSLKAFNKETPELNRFNKRANTIKSLGLSYHHWAALLDATIPFFLYLMLAVAFGCIFYWKGIGYEFYPEKIFAVVLILIYLRGILTRILRVGLVWKKGKIALQKLEKLFQLPLEATYINLEQDIVPPALIFDQVGLQFDKNIVVKELSFTLTSNQIGLIIGESGTGKTVITKLIAGLYAPSSGKIYLGKHSFETLHPKSARQQFTFVSSAFPLYGKTIGNAIAYSPRHKEKAKKIFHRWQILFPQLRTLNFETPLREAGSLSASQRLLLAWLRAILTKKPFFILDDAFLNLDVTTTQQLWAQLPSQAAVLLLTHQPLAWNNLGVTPSWTLELVSKSANLISQEVIEKDSK